ncbi:MAG: RNA pseudouridine synthase [Treponema sp.]|nr:RNA pseudouridine synthase [Treponema sp.]
MTKNTNELLPFQSRILYQSEACVVINKRIGEAVEGAQKNMINLKANLAAYIKTELIEAVNRLDVPVTGCALFALTKPSLSFLGSAFSESLSVKKIYWAIVEKSSSAAKQPESGELVHWIETGSAVNKSFAHNECGMDSGSRERKKAILRYRITGEGKNYLFTEIELISGRHHQIRAQFAAIGLHIKGDLKYGAKRSEKDGGIRLHARFLAFPNPVNENDLISVTADPPAMDNLWQAFTVNHLSP